MFIRIRCTKCRIRFDAVRELLDHVATHEVGRVPGTGAATARVRELNLVQARRES
jgi:hypothetical protein